MSLMQRVERVQRLRAEAAREAAAKEATEEAARVAAADGPPADAAEGRGGVAVAVAPPAVGAATVAAHAPDHERGGAERGPRVVRGVVPQPRRAVLPEGLAVRLPEAHQHPAVPV